MIKFKYFISYNIHMVILYEIKKNMLASNIGTKCITGIF